MTTRTPARRPVPDTAELDAAIAEAQATTIVLWRGEQLSLEAVPERIARISTPVGRELLYGSWVEGQEAINHLYERRLAAWVAAGDPAERADADPAMLSAELARFDLITETPYFAALRRYLALIGIEQGDATEADLWHVLRGSTWTHWFGEREVARALDATGRASAAPGELDGWREAERRLGLPTDAADPTVGVAIGLAFATLAGSPEWLESELRVDPESTAQFVDFAAFVRLWRLRRSSAILTYEQRLYATDDIALQRPYYAGIVGHVTGVALAEAGYLVSVPAPYATVTDLRAAMLAGMIVDVLERRHGKRWWRDPGATELTARLADARAVDDAVAELGYDGVDWRPVLRQIRTRLIGEMSGYGGPNITTRAGTRKV